MSIEMANQLADLRREVAKLRARVDSLELRAVPAEAFRDKATPPEERKKLSLSGKSS